MSDTPDTPVAQYDLQALQQRFGTLLAIAVEYLIEIDGEWGDGQITAEQATREILDEVDARIIRARSGLS